MQMITARNAILTVAMGLFATCAGASTLKVNVPVQANWGGTVLPAGNYTINYSDGSPVMRVSGGGKQATVLVSRTETATASAKSAVTVVEHDGAPAIQSFQSAASGKTFFFDVSADKSVHTAHSNQPAASVVGTR